MSEPILRVRELAHTYMLGTPLQHEALRGIDMTVDAGGCTAVIGHTGCGKSTLIQHFNALLRPQSGSVVVDGQDLSQPRLDVRAVRRKVGLLFQNPEDQIFEKLVGDDIAFGPYKLGLSVREVTDRVKWAMEMVGLPFAEMKDRQTFALSGGQKRKVALAGVLALRPQLLVLDEPTAGLDPRSRKDLLDRIRRLHQTEGLTVIFVSHNMDEVAYLADQVCVLAGGTVVCRGTPREVFSQPDLLATYQIGAPDTVAILHELRRRGFAVDPGVHEVAGAAREIVRILPNEP
ncbi:MAG: energy-coupling factor transporter ATPase [Bacilli bacterium]